MQSSLNYAGVVDLLSCEKMAEDLRRFICNALVIVIVYSFVRHHACKYLDAQRNNNAYLISSLNADINTNFIEFEKISHTIAKMPSGGMVSNKRKLFTVKLAIRAILDGIEGDFLETARNNILNSLYINNTARKCFRNAPQSDKLIYSFPLY